MHDLAVLYDEQGRYAEAEPLHLRDVAISEQQLGPEHPDTATSLNNLAWLYKNQGRYAQAETLFRRALAIREKQLGPDHPATAIKEQLGPGHPYTANTLHGLASLFEAQGNVIRAQQFYQRALAIQEHSLGLEHPETRQTDQHYKALLKRMRRSDEASSADI